MQGSLGTSVSANPTNITYGAVTWLPVGQAYTLSPGVLESAQHAVRRRTGLRRSPHRFSPTRFGSSSYTATNNYFLELTPQAWLGNGTGSVTSTQTVITLTPSAAVTETIDWNISGWCAGTLRVWVRGGQLHHDHLLGSLQLYHLPEREPSVELGLRRRARPAEGDGNGTSQGDRMGPPVDERGQRLQSDDEEHVHDVRAAERLDVRGERVDDPDPGFERLLVRDDERDRDDAGLRGDHGDLHEAASDGLRLPRHGAGIGPSEWDGLGPRPDGRGDVDDHEPVVTARPDGVAAALLRPAGRGLLRTQRLDGVDVERDGVLRLGGERDGRLDQLDAVVSAAVEADVRCDRTDDGDARLLPVLLRDGGGDGGGHDRGREPVRELREVVEPDGEGADELHVRGLGRERVGVGELEAVDDHRATERGGDRVRGVPAQPRADVDAEHPGDGDPGGPELLGDDRRGDALGGGDVQRDEHHERGPPVQRADDVFGAERDDALRIDGDLDVLRAGRVGRCSSGRTSS